MRARKREHERGWKKTQNATGGVSRARVLICFEFNKWSSSPATGHGMLLRHKADSGPQVGTVSLSLSQQHDVMVSDHLCGQIRSGWQSLLPARMLPDRGRLLFESFWNLFLKSFEHFEPKLSKDAFPCFSSRSSEISVQRSLSRGLSFWWCGLLRRSLLKYVKVVPRCYS